jgi:hypothetical protein
VIFFFLFFLVSNSNFIPLLLPYSLVFQMAVLLTQYSQSELFEYFPRVDQPPPLNPTDYCSNCGGTLVEKSGIDNTSSGHAKPPSDKGSPCFLLCCVLCCVERMGIRMVMGMGIEMGMGMGLGGRGGKRERGGDYDASSSCCKQVFPCCCL